MNPTQQYADPVASTEAGNKVLDLMHADLVNVPQGAERHPFQAALFSSGQKKERLWKPQTVAYCNHLNGAVTIMLDASLKSFTGTVSAKLKAHLKETMRVDIAANLNQAQQDEVKRQVALELAKELAKAGIQKSNNAKKLEAK